MGILFFFGIIPTGIPRPLCAWNLPWSEYPTKIIKAESDNLDIWFQSFLYTPDGAGFKLLIVDYYDGCKHKEKCPCNIQRFFKS